MKRISPKIVGIFCLLVWHLNAVGQTEPESSALFIETQQGDDQREIKVGQRLDYQLKGGEVQKKGRLESVQEGSITIAGQQLPVDSLEVLVVKKGKKRPQGVGMTVRSLIALPIFLVLFLLGMREWRGGSGSGGRVALVLLLLVTFVLLPILILIGLIRMATGSKRYDLGKAWKLRIAPKAEK
ncbi:MAG: hypothetical protein IPN95_14750 [Bacteroidetes bacterium]|nr:hypothetical protein [Bacteroidota bacterium]MBL0015973.1 hypothetical protein [Bacteroidota bacterium]